MDGASRWQQFWQITIPMLMPSIVVALIFRTITALQTFDIPYTMTKGGRATPPKHLRCTSTNHHRLP